MTTLNNLSVTPIQIPRAMMVGSINIQKYGLKNISLISEATWSPRLIINHFDGREFTYTLNKSQTEDLKTNFDKALENIIWEHLRIHCVLAQRKEKLLRISEI